MPRNFKVENFSRLTSDVWPSVVESLTHLKEQKTHVMLGNGNGANVIICSEGGKKVTLHEILVRRFTRIFDLIVASDDLRDPMGGFTFILPGVDSETLKALSELLYTGVCFIKSDVKKDMLVSLLAPDLSGLTVESFDIKPDIDLKQEDETFDICTSLDLAVSSTVSLAQTQTACNDNDQQETEPEAPVASGLLVESCDIKPDILEQEDDTFDINMNSDEPESSMEPRAQLQTGNAGEAEEASVQQQIELEVDASQVPTEAASDQQGADTEVGTVSEATPVPFAKRKSSLRKSVKTGMDEECPENLNNIKSLKKQNMLQSLKRTFSCDVCKTQFTKSSRLSRHRRIHTGEKPFTCETCDKQFTRKNILKKHERIHTGEKPFACMTCDKRFVTIGDLKMHQRIHTGEKPFACDTCEKRFSNCGDLKRHKRTHTGEKPFACETCDKRFTQTGGLKKHKRTHTGEKPFACETCEKRFNEKSKLIRHHKVTHLGEKPFACKTCGKQFTRSSSLNVHKERNHAVGGKKA